MLQNMRKIAKRFTNERALKTLNRYNYLHNQRGLRRQGIYWLMNINGFTHRWRLYASYLEGVK